MIMKMNSREKCQTGTLKQRGEGVEILGKVG